MRPDIKAGRADAAVRQLDPSKSRSLGGGTAQGSTSSDVVDLRQYRLARARLNATLDLLSEAIELRERLWMGVLDLDEAKRQRADLDRAVRNFLAARNERGRRP
jgi:hypothetical protein